MKAHIPTRPSSQDEATVFFFLALRNLYGFGRKRLADVYSEVDRLTREAARDPDWMYRVKRHFDGIGIRIR